MKKLSVSAASILIGALCILSSHYAWSQINILPSDPLKGRDLFVSKGCIKCHAVEGKGGVLGPDLGKVQPGYSVLKIAGVMWNHYPTMSEKMKELKIPEQTFTVGEMAALIAYLYYIHYFDEPGDAARGRALFREKRCIKCHRIGDEGSPGGRPLDELKRYVSPISMAQVMWNHGPKIVARMRQLGVQRPTFGGNEIADLMAFFREVSKETGGEKVYMLPGNPQRGEQIFADKGCVRCHTGGEESLGPDLSSKLFRGNVSQIAGIMWNHGPQMWRSMRKLGMNPPTFSGNEMADLIAYLYFLDYFDEPGNPVSGQRIFSEKGCRACHSFYGEKREGPDLSESSAFASPINAAAQMWNHASAMKELMEEKMISWPVFRGQEFVDLVSYFQYLRATKRRE